MRVKDFILLYSGMNRVEVEICASVTIFNEQHYVPVAEFAMDCANLYTKRTENYLSEEVIGFDIVNGSIRFMIRGCE